VEGGGGEEGERGPVEERAREEEKRDGSREERIIEVSVRSSAET